MLLLVVVVVLLLSLLLRAPQKWRKKKLKRNEWNWKKNKNIMEISLVPVYIVNGENHCAFYWFDICCPLSFCLFVLFAWFVFHFSASSQWYFTCFYFILIRFSFEHFPKQFSLAVDQICIMHTHACVQNPITNKYFVFLFLEQKIEAHFWKLNWNIWTVLKQVLCTMYTANIILWCPTVDTSKSLIGPVLWIVNLLILPFNWLHISDNDLF